MAVYQKSFNPSFFFLYLLNFNFRLQDVAGSTRHLTKINLA